MEVPVVEACEEFLEGVATQDVQLGDSVWVRIFLPQSTHPAQDKAKPLVLYAHGGAYCKGQPHWLQYHAFCSTMCKLSHSIWVSLSYRLAPAHRLPAAFDDASLALSWLISQAQQQPSHTSHPWLCSNLADFSNVFLAGESAGANIMLKIAMVDCILSDVKPLCIRGLMLIQPGFHSEEKRGVMDNEDLYNMALPEGETLDYAPVNVIHTAAPPLGPLFAYHIFLNAAETDFRYDNTLRFYDIVKGICSHVQLVITPGKGHVFHLKDATCPETHDLHAQLVSFMHACTTT